MTTEVTQVTQQISQDYLAYAQAVNLGRAIPSVLDGLKPVQRRILYTMHDMGLDFDKPYKKAARVEGDVMGKYHPHSGSYPALVNLANSWANRYALIDGQGNWGTVSDGAAAARYTEARLNEYSQTVLTELLDKAWCDFKPNYDDSLTEPVVLPARLPLLLLRDSAGIGVASACSHVSYNLKQVAKLSVAALQSHGNLQPDKALAFVTQPDFAMAGQVLADDGMRSAIVTGQGTIRMFGKVELDVDNRQIVATELPQDVSPEAILNQTFTMLKSESNGVDRKILADVRDESDRAGTRVVWELTQKAWDAGKAGWLLAQLYRYTDLQTHVSVNAVSVDASGTSYSCKGVAEVANEWAKYRVSFETKRVQVLFTKVQARSHVIEGLLIALANIVKIAKALIVGQELSTLSLKLSDVQIASIEAMPLSSLRAKNKAKLEAELLDLTKQQTTYAHLLGDELAMIAHCCDDVRDLAKQFGDKLRTTIYTEPAFVVTSVALVAAEAEAAAKQQSLGWLTTSTTNSYRRATTRSSKANATSQKLEVGSDFGIAAVLSDGKLHWLPATALQLNAGELDIKQILASYAKPFAPGTVVLWSAIVDRANKKQLSKTKLTLTNPKGKQNTIDLTGLLTMTNRRKSVWVGGGASCVCQVQ